MPVVRTLALWAGPLVAAATATSLQVAGYGSDTATVGFVAALCVIWWVFEPIPIPVTSLLPLAILPLLGVLTPAEVGQAYGSPLILLLLGGFLLSKAMEHSGAHRRIALGMVSPVSYTHLTLPTTCTPCRSRWSPYH